MAVVFFIHQPITIDFYSNRKVHLHSSSRIVKSIFPFPFFYLNMMEEGIAMGIRIWGWDRPKTHFVP
jgi:hypothetical protein